MNLPDFDCTAPGDEESEPDLQRLRDRYANQRALRHSPNPEVAATIAALRGLNLESEQEFAERIGVDPSLIVRAETGHLSLEDLPETLQFLIRRFNA
jgi:hypothetical protein